MGERDGGMLVCLFSDAGRVARQESHSHPQLLGCKQVEVIFKSYLFSGDAQCSIKTFVFPFLGIL